MAAVLGGCHGDSVLLYCAASSPSLQSFHRDCLRSRRTLDMICTNSSDYIIGKLYDMYVCHYQNPILALIPRAFQNYTTDQKQEEFLKLDIVLLKLSHSSTQITTWTKNQFIQEIVHRISKEGIWPKKLSNSLRTVLSYLLVFK